MKHFLTLLLSLCLYGAAAQNAPLYTLTFNKVTLHAALDTLEKISGKHIYYSGSQLNTERIVSAAFSQETLRQILKSLIADPKLIIREESDKVILRLDPNPAHTLYGFIRDAGSRENLIGVTIICNEASLMTQTNAYGYFSLRVPAGNYHIRFSYVGYTTQEMEINAEGDEEIHVLLDADETLKEMVVHAPRETGVNGIGQIEIPVHKLNDLPAFLGENDPLRMLGLMPGVSKGNEISQGLFVRGGTPDQNLVLIDDATLYSAYHLFGLSSLFTGSEMRKAELSKGGFSARYGGRASSVLNINLKDGNRQKWEGDAGLGILASHLQVNGPIVKNKSSLLVSYRRTYLDLIAKPFMPQDEKGSYYYYDLSIKANADINDHNRIYLSVYGGRDIFEMYDGTGGSVTKANINWGNNAYAFRWNCVSGKNSFLNTTLSSSNYKSNIHFSSEDSGMNSQASFNSSINDLSLKTDFDWMPHPHHWIKTGGGITRHIFLPNLSTSDNGGSTMSKTSQMQGFESYLYLEDKFRITPRATLTPGIRLSMFSTNATYVIPEPRVLLQYKASEKVSLNFSYSIMAQYMTLVSTGMVGLPSEIWIPVTQKLKPQQTQQVTAGYGYAINNNWYVGQEVFTRNSKNFTAYKEGINLLYFLLNSGNISFDLPYFESILTQGNNTTLGTELYLRYQKKKIESWLSYTLSKTTQEFNDVNLGRPFPAYYDRRHDINTVFIYKPSPKWILSFSWVFGSGYAMSLPSSTYSVTAHTPTDAGGLPIGFENYFTATQFNYKNNFRTLPYHKLDISINYKIYKAHGTHFLALNVYNVYNRQNPAFYHIDYSPEKNKNVLVQTSLIPVIPSISWKYVF